MIIDAHAHSHELKTFGWYHPPEKVIELMDEAGIDISVITTYADEPGPAPSLSSLEQYVQKYPDRLIGFPRINPRYGQQAVDIFERAIRNNKHMRGLKLHPISNVVKPFAPLCLNLLRKAGELGVPVFFHCGDRALAQPLQIGKAAEKCPDTMIICHMGGYFHAEDSISVSKKHKNIILDTSSTPYLDIIKKAIDVLGPKRVVFASDSPAGDPVSEVAKIKILELSKEVEECILWRNIAEILNIESLIHHKRLNLM